MQAAGGLIIANVIKYTDNIIKAFAAAISIVLSAICSYYLLHDTAFTLYAVKYIRARITCNSYFDLRTTMSYSYSYS